MTVVNGFMLKNAIRQWEIRRDMLKTRFVDSIWAFSDDTKPKPEEVMKEYTEAENVIATLQSAQAEYNNSVLVASGDTITSAIKSIGGYVRISAMWRSAMSDSGGLSGYFSTSTRSRRSKEEEQAEKQVTDEMAFDKFAKADKIVNKMRSDIAEANATERDIVWLDQDLLVATS